MTLPTAAALRQSFLDYFKRHGHSVVKSSPLVPAGDPTLMFTNAGMVQFKEVFVGAETRPYKRATTCQKVMRVSGKHNDLEEVGRTARHHTFFEMLGNFSFGDYFKEQAIVYAWEFITREVGLQQDKLWVTVFGGADGVPADSEARQLWRKISGLPDSRILDKGMKDNFWAMGDVGPCGPCTEIHFDQGQGIPSEDDFDNGRVMEIWNNVFMQFDRQPGGKLQPLPAPSVDTGMGLERLVALVQHADSNYHSDVFLPLLNIIAEAAGKPYQRSPSEDDVSMRVIADHARATAFLVADGVQPSNEGRGYVMRRIMRRAIRHGRRLGFTELFLHRICDSVVEQMAPAYPELREAKSLIDKVAQLEEEGFRRTLDTGLKILADEVEQVRQHKGKTLAGDVVFKLYDTYGFPKDLTEVIATENQLHIDEAGFERAMQVQKERSRGGDVGDKAVAAVHKQLAQRIGAIPFIGYTHEDEPLDKRTGAWRLHHDGGTSYLQAQVTVKALVVKGKEVQTHSAGSGDAEIVLHPTPFYGESGGQVGDAGFISGDNGLRVSVLDSQKPLEGFTVSRIRLQHGTLRVGDTVWAGYDPAVRKQTRAHHSGTHLLHGSLRKILGEHVKQAGSMVDAKHLRFDYAHFAAPSHAELHTIEADANRAIADNAPVVTEELSFDAAKQKGAIALFGEKYGDVVRVLTMGESVEFCGGTHANRTGDLDMLLIIREEAVQSGVRRIEAEVGQAARATARRFNDRLGLAARLLLGQTPAVPADADADAAPAMQAIAKALRQSHDLMEELQAAGVKTEPFVAEQHDVSVPALAPSFGVREAAAQRDAWQSLVQLINARATDVPTIIERLGDHDPGRVLHGLAALLQANRDNERLAEQHRRSERSAQAGNLMDQVRTVGGISLLATEVAAMEAASLREMADALRANLPSGVLCIASQSEGKVSLLITVSKDLTKRLRAGDLVKELAPLVGGRGGGKPEMAQAGGTDPAGIPKVFARLNELLAGHGT